MRTGELNITTVFISFLTEQHQVHPHISCLKTFAPPFPFFPFEKPFKRFCAFCWKSPQKMLSFSRLLVIVFHFCQLVS
jgi:hypothetical protein